MKKPYALIIATFFALPGLAQTTQQTSPSQSPQRPGGPNGQSSSNGQDFAQHKQEILQHMQARLQATQTAISCIQAANDHQALQSCREQERQAMGGGMEHGKHR